MTLQRDGTIHVIQGDHHVSDVAGVVMTTVLGSCVAACLYDPDRHLGGMNHFLLPDSPGQRDIRHASAAMEQLVNAMLKRGASRSQLVAKLFGGARMQAGLPDIGSRNAEAARQFLKNEGIRLQSHSLGGTMARRVRFWPETGRAQQMLLSDRVEPALFTPRPITSGGTIDLF